MEILKESDGMSYAVIDGKCVYVPDIIVREVDEKKCVKVTIYNGKRTSEWNKIWERKINWKWLMDDDHWWYMVDRIKKAVKIIVEDC